MSDKEDIVPMHNVIIGTELDCRHSYCIIIGSHLESDHDFQLVIGDKDNHQSLDMTPVEYADLRNAILKILVR